MNLKNSRKLSRDKDISLNITPLIDIVFLLLIFFMVSTNFEKISKVSLSLPKAEQDFKQNIDSNKITIIITKNGEYLVNNQLIINNYKQTLVNAISNILDKISNQNESEFDKHDIYSNTSIVINGDANAPHQAVINVLDAAGELGISNIKISVIKQT